MLIALNTALALGAGLDFAIAGIGLTVFDVVGLAIAGVMCALMVGRAIGNLRRAERGRARRRALLTRATGARVADPA